MYWTQFLWRNEDRVFLPLESASPKVNWIKRIALALVVCAALAIWIGADRLPANATRPIEWRGETELKSLSGKMFRIASFNIHAGKGTDGVLDLARVANCLAKVEPDFANLNEVRSARYGIPMPQLDEIADRLDMAAAFLPAERQFWRPSYGNGLLSNVATGPVYKLPLPCTQGRKYRLAALTSFQAGGRTVQVLCVHLDRVDDRAAQLEYVFTLFASLEAPAIMMGDLNTCYHEPVMENYLKLPGVRDVLREHLGKDDMLYRVDWILARGLKTVEAGVLENDASDHPLVWAEFAVED